MIDLLKIHISVDLEGLMRMLALQCQQKLGARGHEAAKEAFEVARLVKGAIGTIEISGADVAARVCNALRREQRQDLVDKMNTLVRLIEHGHQRRIVGSAMLGADIHNIVENAGDAGARVVAMEDPRSGDLVEIAKIRGGLNGK